MLSEIIETEEDKYCMISYTENLKVKRKFKKYKKRLDVISRGGGSREGEMEKGDQNVQIFSYKKK